MRETTHVWIGLGSNLSDPEFQILRALDALATLPASHLLWRSRLYETVPVGGVPQPNFVNAVACLATALPAPFLLRALQDLEEAAGRRRLEEIFWGPRVLDLDILLYGNQALCLPGLTVPHPRMAERAFVLVPLMEWDGDLRIPGMGTVGELLARCGGEDGVQPLPETPDRVAGSWGA